MKSYPDLLAHSWSLLDLILFSPAPRLSFIFINSSLHSTPSSINQRIPSDELPD